MIGYSEMKRREAEAEIRKEVKVAIGKAIKAHESGNAEEAEKLLRDAHASLNTEVLDPEKRHRHAWSGHAPCVCSTAETLAMTALVLDLQRVADTIRYGTYCPEYRFDRPAPLEDRCFDAPSESMRSIILEMKQLTD